ncbi:antibiotic biosynthesis monooxygenase [Rhodobiaceae bacterium]|nr:antibiotic biosynthesis monooxygenase [Rhodobiaceae bacterium]
MIVAIFRARVRSENADEYYALADEMGDIARAMPGFISWKGYFAEDGERVSVHEWESAQALEAWRTHPEHLRIQELGREKFYDEFTLYVLDDPRTSKFVRT